MIRTQFTFTETHHRLYLNGSNKNVNDPGIRCYGKCLGFLARFFGLAITLRTPGEIRIVNKKSYFKWKERLKETLLPSSPKVPLKSAPPPPPPPPSLYQLNEDVLRLIVKKLPAEELLSLITLQKKDVLFTDLACVELLRTRPHFLISKQQIMKLACKQGARLEELDLSNLPLIDEDLIQLSKQCPHLKILKLSQAFESLPGLTDQGIAALPRELMSLKLRFHPGLTPRFIKLLPPQLRSLDMKRFDLIRDQDVANLPRSLTHLKMRMGTLCSPEGIKNLPPQLKSLSVPKSNHNPWDASHINQLPGTLSSLTLLNRLCLEGEEPFHFPPDLTTLAITYAFLRPGWIEKLPPMLKSLTLIDCGNFSDEEAENLPGQLQELYLYDADNLSSVGVGKFPKHLHTLTLENCENITDAWVSQLSQNLHTLILGFASDLTDDCIPSLPKLLRSLYLLDAEKLTGSTFHELPAMLETLYLLEASKLGDAAIEHLPRSLDSLYINASNLTLQGLQHLPPNLYSLSIKACDNLRGPWIGVLPKKLRSLTLNDFGSLTKEDFNFFPKTLKLLVINRTNEQLFDEKSVQLLKKRGLRRIIINDKYF